MIIRNLKEAEVFSKKIREGNFKDSVDAFGVDLAIELEKDEEIKLVEYVRADFFALATDLNLSEEENFSFGKELEWAEKEAVVKFRNNKDIGDLISNSKSYIIHRLTKAIPVLSTALKVQKLKRVGLPRTAEFIKRNIELQRMKKNI